MRVNKIINSLTLERPVGFEPTMRELQSRALDQTWQWTHKKRRHEKRRPHFKHLPVV